MPKALADFLGYCIYFWIGDGKEPIHVHIAKDEPQKDATKIWIKEDGIELAHNNSHIPNKDLKAIGERREHIDCNKTTSLPVD